jgi:hypothetical protein
MQFSPLAQDAAIKLGSAADQGHTSR